MRRWSGVAEKLVLCLLAVLVHGLAHRGEVHQWVAQKVVVFVVAVSQDEQLDQLDELEACLLAEFVEQPRELLLSEGYERVEHGALLLATLPLVKERLVG